MNKRHRYTKEQEAFLVATVDGIAYTDLAGLFNKKFHANLSGSAIRQKCYSLGVRNKINPRFQRNMKPASTKPTGAESIDEDGNPIIKVGQPRDWRKKSHVVFEAHYGGIPENHFIIFLNRNKKDCRIENLVSVSRPTFYRLVHSGMYTEDEEVTRVGITIAFLRQKITEYEQDVQRRR